MAQQTIRVLLIEDDPDDVTLIRHLLSETHEHEAAPRFELKAADRLSTGLQLLAQEPFEVILLDLMLPGGVGIEAFPKMKETRAETPVVVLTGLRDESLAVEAVALGAQDYLLKGTIGAQVLKRSLKYAIERQRLLGRLQSVLNNDRDGKIVVDQQGIVRFVNPAAQSLLSRSSREVLGRPLPLQAPLEGPLDEKLPDGRGGELIVEARSSLLDWDGRPGRLVTLRDVTDLRRMESLREEVKERMLAVDLKNEFMTTISHELRNPLTTVKTAVQSLRDGLVGPLSPQQQRFVELAHRNVERQIRIINNVLDLARFQSGRARVDLKRLSLAQAVDDALQGYALSASGPRVETQFHEGLPEVSADPDLVTQVVTNLVDNALRFARERVLVRLSPAAEGGVMLTVADDGPGMAESQASRLFAKFVQVSRQAGAQGGYKGTGLGLSICKEIVSGHGGRIWVDSAPGKGARFHVVWPSETAAPSQTALIRE
jgi:signal transduction histidine kinase